jgi:hypothetical protein
MSLNNDYAVESYIHFRTLTMQPSTSVDLLWSRNVNRYKMDGAGYVDGQVQMNFIHALSKITVNVKAIVDHASETDTDERYPADLNANTRIYIESVELLRPTASSGLSPSVKLPNKAIPIHGTSPNNSRTPTTT